jgi:hypothetical protein
LSDLQLHGYVSSNNLHIIGYVENCLHDGISDSEISILGFTIYRKDWSTVKHGKGGGAILYVHNSLSSTIAIDLNSFKSESVWCRINIGKVKSFLVGCCYRSQQAPDDEVNSLFSAIQASF